MSIFESHNSALYAQVTETIAQYGDGLITVHEMAANINSISEDIISFQKDWDEHARIEKKYAPTI